MTEAPMCNSKLLPDCQRSAASPQPEFEMHELIGDPPVLRNPCNTDVRSSRLLGGMRNVLHSLDSVPPWARSVGQSVHAFWNHSLDTQPELESALLALVDGSSDEQPDLETPRRAFQTFIGASSIDAVDCNDCKSPLLSNDKSCPVLVLSN